MHSSARIFRVIGLCPTTMIYLLAATLQLQAAIPPCWVSYYTKFFSNKIYLYNTGSRQLRTVYDSRDQAVCHPAFSPDGKQLAFIRRSDSNIGTVMVVNNDGTGARVVCNTFTRKEFPMGGTNNICWTQQGLFWVENDRNVYWADPVTGERKTLGAISVDSKAEMLSMSVDGTRAYLHINHDLTGGIGALYFDVTPNAGGMTNQRYTPEYWWDHGGALLPDGSAAVWIIWYCGSIGDPPGCSNDHNYLGVFDYNNISRTGTPIRDPLNRTELSGPESGLHVAPNAPDLVRYSVNCWGAVGDNTILNIRTREYLNFNPTSVIPDEFYYGGSFWAGDLPNPGSTGFTVSEVRTSRGQHAVTGVWDLRGRATTIRSSGEVLRGRTAYGVAVVASAEGCRSSVLLTVPANVR